MCEVLKMVLPWLDLERRGVSAHRSSFWLIKRLGYSLMKEDR